MLEATTERRIVLAVIMPGQKTTEEQIREIKEAARRPVVPDEDCPELAPEQYAEMAQTLGKHRKGILSRL